MIDETTAIRINRAMSRGRDELLDALVALFSSLPSVMDVTMLAVSADQSSVQRIATSNDGMFAKGGGEGLDPADPWCQRIMVEKLPVLANDRAGLAHYLTEAGEIEAAGYGASGSFPIIIGNRVAGTVNILASEGYFSGETTARIEALLPFAALAFLFPSERQI